MTTRQEVFLDTYQEMHDTLDRLSVPFFTLGSVAAWSYTETAPDFDRPHAELVYQIPDIDLVVPRDDLAAARELRKTLVEPTRFPVRVGLALVCSHIDWQPEAPISFLTTRNHKVPIKSSVFDVVLQYIGDTEVVTIDPQTLLYSLRLASQHIQPRHIQTMLDLQDVIERDGTSVDESDLFHPFSQHAHNLAHDPLRRLVGFLAKYEAQMPARTHDRLHPLALGVAGLLHLR